MISNKLNIKQYFTDETSRERAFYKARNLTCPKDVVQDNKECDEMESKLMEAHQESDYHRMDEQVNLCLECSGGSDGMVTLKVQS